MIKLRGGATATNTLWSLANEGLTLVAATLSVLLLIPHLGPTQYGAFAGLFALVGPFAAFAQSGVQLSILEHTVGTDQRPGDVVRSCGTLALTVSALVAPPVVLLGALFFDALSVSTIIFFVATELVVQAVLLAIVATIQGSYRYSTGIVFRSLGQVLRIVVLIVLVALGRLTLAHLAVANFVTIVAYTAVLAVMTPRFGLGVLRPGAIERRHARSAFTYAFGLSASITQNDGDKVVLNAANHSASSGVYAAAYRLVTIGMVPLTAFTSSTHFAVLRSVRDSVDQLQKAKRFALVGAVYAVPMTLLLILVAPLVPKLLGDDFNGATTMIRLLSPVLLLRGLGVFAINGLLGLDRNRLRSEILVGNAVLSVVLYIALIPPFSWGALSRQP